MSFSSEVQKLQDSRQEIGAAIHRFPGLADNRGSDRASVNIFIGLEVWFSTLHCLPPWSIALSEDVDDEVL